MQDPIYSRRDARIQTEARPRRLNLWPAVLGVKARVNLYNPARIPPVSGNWVLERTGLYRTRAIAPPNRS